MNFTAGTTVYINKLAACFNGLDSIEGEFVDYDFYEKELCHVRVAGNTYLFQEKDLYSNSEEYLNSMNITANDLARGTDALWHFDSGSLARSGGTDSEEYAPLWKKDLADMGDEELERQEGLKAKANFDAILNYGRLQSYGSEMVPYESSASTDIEAEENEESYYSFLAQAREEMIVPTDESSLKSLCANYGKHSDRVFNAVKGELGLVGNLYIRTSMLYGAHNSETTRIIKKASTAGRLKYLLNDTGEKYPDVFYGLTPITDISLIASECEKAKAAFYKVEDKSNDVDTSIGVVADSSVASHDEAIQDDLDLRRRSSLMDYAHKLLKANTLSLGEIEELIKPEMSLTEARSSVASYVNRHEVDVDANKTQSAGFEPAKTITDTSHAERLRKASIESRNTELIANLLEALKDDPSILIEALKKAGDR